MNWVKRKLSCKCITSESGYRFPKESHEEEEYDEFNSGEIKWICRWFHLNNYDEILRLTPYHFKNRWDGVLAGRLLSKWVAMLFNNSQGNVSDHLWGRLHWLLVKQWRGRTNERALVTIAILAPGKESINCKKLKKYISDVLDSLQLIMEFSENSDFKKWIKCGSFPQADCFFSLREHIQKNLLNKVSINSNELESWFDTVKVYRDILGEVCSLCVNLNPPARQLLPSPMCNIAWNSFINIGHLIFLSSHLDQDDTVEWRLLYNRNIHGGGLTKFGKYVKDKGPSLMLIKDENQNIFGAFVSQSWTSGKQFYGDDKCFLFTLYPEMDLYKPTGTNSNFQYFCDEEEYRRRGVGLGGSLRNFTIWLDESLEQGICSQECPTFKGYIKPSKNFVFDIKEFQIWATRDKCECKQVQVSFYQT